MNQVAARFAPTFAAVRAQTAQILTAWSVEAEAVRLATEQGNSESQTIYDALGAEIHDGRRFYRAHIPSP
jgi:hypothetical protein